MKIRKTIFLKNSLEDTAKCTFELGIEFEILVNYVMPEIHKNSFPKLNEK
jgi:hypothetical protein